MSFYQCDLFEISENEKTFEDICDKLKTHPFKSPWNINGYESKCENNVSYEVREFTFPALNEAKFNRLVSKERQKDQPIAILFPEECVIQEKCSVTNLKLMELKNSLIQIQENSAVDDIKGVEILHTLSLSEVPKLCTILSSISMNDTVAALFLNTVLAFEMPIGLSLSSALIKFIVYPQVFGNQLKCTGARNLLAAVISFSEVYPKAFIDEVIIPCLKKPSIEPLQLETLLKVAKTSLPAEYVSYCIKSILEGAVPVENTFTLLLHLVERKINLEVQLHEKIAWKAETWSSANVKNVKFTKLIISILTVYRNELEEKQLSVYQDLIRSNKTIMKRAAENALKRSNM